MRHLVQSQTTFGRRGAVAAAVPQSAARPTDDLKLFSWTFAAGFVFMTVFLA
jgi:hypothetical protein